MATLIRSWFGLAALGAGLIHLAVAATASLPILLLYSVIGLAELTWAIAVLARTTVPLPRIAMIAALVPTVAWVVLLLSGSMSGMHSSALHTGTGMNTDLPPLPMLAASLLNLVPAVWLAVLTRLQRDPRLPDARTPRPLPYLAGVLAGTGVIIGVTSIALGGTLVGMLAARTMKM